MLVRNKEQIAGIAPAERRRASPPHIGASSGEHRSRFLAVQALDRRLAASPAGCRSRDMSRWPTIAPSCATMSRRRRRSSPICSSRSRLFFRDPAAFQALAEKVDSAALRRKGRQRHDPRLGGRLRHRRGGLQRGDASPRRGRPSRGTAGHSGVRVRSRHRRHRDRPRRPLSRRGRGGRERGSAEPILHARRRSLPRPARAA